MRGCLHKRLSRWLKTITLFLCGGTSYTLGEFTLSTQSSTPVKEVLVEVDQLGGESHFSVFKQKIKPIMEHYCYDCHGDGAGKGELDMDRFTSFASMTKDRETWAKIKDHLELKLMPPVDEEQPDAKEVKLITQWIDDTVFYTDSKNPDPGKVVIRRLNRNEYKNTIYDLLGVELDVESLLPLDDTGYGFDTISDVHTVSSAHIEKYLMAAEIALNQATILGDMPWPRQTIELNELSYTPSKLKNGHFYMNGSAQFPEANFQKLKKGNYILAVEASSTPAGDEDAVLEIKLDNRSVAKFPISSEIEHRLCEVTLPLDKKSKLTLHYINDLYEPNNPDSSRRDRNLSVREIYLTGPIDGKRPTKPETHRSIFPERSTSQTPEIYAQEVWLKFARKAFRRDVKLEEIKSYSQFLHPEAQSEKEFLEQISLGIQAMLISPHFLYLKSDPEKIDTSEPRWKSHISEYALASRLSYFLWSSPPDSILLEKAANRKLRKNLESEINRMLDDSKSSRFISNFGGQWLQIRDLRVHSPNLKIYPEWNRSIQQDAIKETENFLKHLILDNRSALDCLDSDYTYLNENLAKFYGIDHVKGDHFRKVTFTSEQRKQRGGLLGHASILTLTSHPDRNSPVMRGKWVLENIIGTPPPPPPQDIPALEIKQKNKNNLSLRAQLEEHREKAECAACHNLLDPLGFALQNFSGIGKWQTHSTAGIIDTSGKLISGEEIRDGEQLRNVLRSKKSIQFINCLTEKLLVYSIGRGLQYYDKPAIDKILEESISNKHSFRALIHSVCKSTPFQMTRTKYYKSP